MNSAKHILQFPTVILICLFFCIFFFLHNVQAQPTTIGYNCTAPLNQSTPNSCQAYVFYRAASPDYLDLAAVGDLFSVSRLMISRPSNISEANATLTPGQPLLIPVTCSCNTVNASITISYAALNYTILSGDTYYRVSTLYFQNLTTYESVEVVNPTFEPTRLNIGDVIIFPIFCRCPNSSQVRDRVNYLVSYVFQPADRLSDVASRLGSTQQSIIDVNGNNIQPYDTIFVPVSRLPNLTQPTVAPPNPNNGNNNTNSTNNNSRNNVNDNRGLEIGLGIALGICGIVVILICAMWWHREKTLKREKGEFYRGDEKMVDRGSIGSGLKAEEVNLMADVSGCLDKYRVFGIEELKKATDDFDGKCLIQGSVYKGCIDGEFFAIKKMKWNAYEELKILQKVNHGNLVRLEGFCIDPQEANCYLVYEYVENGSLHSWLHDPARPEKLSWKTRLRIAIDVANGLQYIHEHTRPRVVHKDIKSSNILLDPGMRAKVANFGLARSGLNAMTAHVVGTHGYMAPEYLSDGVVSTKTDVFAFGVVLLELVSGREAVDDRGNPLWVEAHGLLEGQALGEWVDSACVGGDAESVAGVAGLGVACIDRDPARRPTMVEIVYALSKSGDAFLDLSEEGFSPRKVAAR